MYRRYNPEGLSRDNIVPGLIGCLQLGVVLAAAWGLFEVPMAGSPGLLMGMVGACLLANLAVGFTFSTLARNQLQAMQMALFFFPRIVRSIMLKSNGLVPTLPELWPVLLFLVLSGALALKRYRQALD